MVSVKCLLPSLCKDLDILRDLIHKHGLDILWNRLICLPNQFVLMKGLFST